MAAIPLHHGMQQADWYKRFAPTHARKRFAATHARNEEFGI